MKKQGTGLAEEEIVLLKAAAEKVLPCAYAPYSGIRVAAALLDAKGGVHTGCNVENSSYSLTICAERSCLFGAVARGCRCFKGMVVVSDSEMVNSPCGACRQVLWEFAPHLEVVVFNPSGAYYYQLETLLPAAFALEENSRRERLEGEGGEEVESGEIGGTVY